MPSASTTFRIARKTSKIDLMATLMPRPDMTVTASVRADWNQYPTLIGRQGYDTFRGHAAMASGSSETARRGMACMGPASIIQQHAHGERQPDAGAPLATDTPDDTLGGPTYPLADRWWAADEERNWSGGASLTHYFGAARYLGRTRLDFSWKVRGVARHHRLLYARPAL